MGATVASLGIELTAYDRTSKSINSVINSLSKLNLALNNYSSGSKYISAMNGLSRSFYLVSDSINSIDVGKLNGIASGVKKISSALGGLDDNSVASINKTKSSIQGLDSVIKKEATTITEYMGISGKKAFDDVSMAVRDYHKALATGSDSDTAFRGLLKNLTEVYSQMGIIKGEYSSLLDYIANTNATRKINMGFKPSEFGNDYTSMRATLGKAFTTSGDISGGDISSYVREMQSVIGHQGIDTSGSTASTFEQLVSLVRRARDEMESLNTEYAESDEVQMAFQEVLKGTESRLRSVINANNNLATSENARQSATAGAMADETRAISGTPGDITATTNALNQLGDVKVNNIGDISKIANAVSKLGGGATAGAMTNLPLLTEYIRKLVTSLNSAGGITFDTSKFASLGTAISKLGGKTAGNAPKQLPQIASALDRFVPSVNKISSVTFNADSLLSLANAISRLGSKTASKATENLPKMGTYLAMFIKAMNQIGGAKFDVTALGELAKVIGRLGGKNSQQAIQNLPLLTNEIKNLITTLSQAPMVSQNLTNLLTAVGRIAKYSNRGASGGGGGSSTSNMNMMQYLMNSKAGTGILNNLGGSISRVGGLLVKSLVPGMDKANRSTKGFVSTIGMFYAKYFLVIRVVKAIMKAVKSATDYIETYNYFEQSFENLDTSGWKEAGYKSAEAYLEGFKQQAETEFTKMTGYDVDKNGDILNNAQKSLGLNPTDVMNYQAQYTQIADSMGVTSETAVKLSNTLTKLGADIASLRNVDFETAWDNLSSGVLAGQSRVLDKYGINVRTAALNQKLLELGIDTTAQKLGQEDKALLRTIIALDASKGAWGDLARTIDTPANRMRLLRENVQKLGLALGTVLVQAVAKVLPYLNAMVIVLTRLFEYIAKIFGFDLSSLGANSKVNADVYSEIADEADDASDKIDDATESQKKFNKQLANFDELNNMTTNDDDGTSGDGTSGLTNATPQLEAALNDLIEKYNKKWQSEFDKMVNKAQELADRIQKALINAWKTMSGTALGKAFANFLNRAIESSFKAVDIATSINKRLALILATALNGFVQNFKWQKAGLLAGKIVRSVTDAVALFFKKTKWTRVGEGLAQGLNGFVNSGVIQSYFDMLGSMIRAGIDTAFGFVKKFNFKGLGRSVGQSINEFFENLSVKRESGLTGWQELGATISGAIQGIAQALTEGLKTVDWASIGQGILDMLLAIDWSGLVIDVSNLINALIDAIVEFCNALTDSHFGVVKLAVAIASIFALVQLGGYIKASCAEVATTFLLNLSQAISVSLANVSLKAAVSGALSKAVEGAKISGKAIVKVGDVVIRTLGSAISGAKNAFLASSIGSSIVGAFSAVPGLMAGPLSGLATASAGAIAATIFTTVVAAIAAAFAGFQLGKLIGNAIVSKKNKQYQYNWKFSDLFTYDIKEWVNGFKAWFADVFAWLKKHINTIIIPFNIPLGVLLNIDKVKDFALSIKDALINALGGLFGGLGGKKPKSKSSKTTTKADGGVFKNGSWHRVQKFATGGLPERGQYFIARENGPELVGTIGSNTGVVNNQQIVASVSNGVASAVANVMTPVLSQVVSAVNNSNASGVSFEGLSDGDIVRIVKDSAVDYERRTGRPFFA